jgi:hypothetical protein
MSSEPTHDNPGGAVPPEPPVGWDKLKKIQDEHPPPRLPGGAVLAVLLLGLCVLCFFLAFESVFDPEETVEPARYFAIAVVALGVLAGWAGMMFIFRSPPRE